jgi:hypothetical protein
MPIAPRKVRSRRPAGKGWLKGGDGCFGSAAVVWRRPSERLLVRDADYFTKAASMPPRPAPTVALTAPLCGPDENCESGTKPPGRLSRYYAYETTKEMETPESIPSERVVGYTQV